MSAYLPGNTEYYSNSRQEMLAFLPANFRSVLDVGCGQGGFLKSVKNAFPQTEIWGVELNQAAVEIAKQVSSNIFVADIEKNPIFWPENYFDCIFFNDVLEHVKDPEAVLRHFKKYLKEDGVIIVSLPNVRYIKNIYNLLIRKEWEYEDCGILDRTHLRFYTLKSMQRLIREQGFRIKRIEGIHSSRIPMFWLLSTLSFGLLRDCKFMNYVFVAGKN